MIILHTVMIRYSLFLEDLKAWKISRTNLDEYKKKLFNSERLQGRLRLFKDLTLPCLIRQNLIDERIDDTDIHKFQVFLSTSEELPQEHQQELNELANQYKWLNVCYLPSKGVTLDSVITDYVENLYELLQKPIIFSSIRLDDDDALSVDYLNNLQEYTVEENIGRAITFANGYYGVYDSQSNKFLEICELFSPKLALGLALINKYDKNGYSDKYSNGIKTIYGAGNHTLIDHRMPVISDGLFPQYIRTVHNHADSHNLGSIRQTINTNKHVHPIKVMKSLGLTFPVLFDGVSIDITQENLNRIKLYEFRLKNSMYELDTTVQLCFLKENVLIQFSNSNLKGDILEVTLDDNNNCFIEKITIDTKKMQSLISIDKDNFYIYKERYESSNVHQDTNIDSITTNHVPLCCHVKLNTKGKLYEHTFSLV